MDQKDFHFFSVKNVQKLLFLSIFNQKCTKSSEPAELTQAREANDSSKFLYIVFETKDNPFIKMKQKW